ncbi:MAG: fibronectin type III domain-containing protein [Eubacterium sp.]|nr:fibronectin type III domain-containing protein [Eubacterium sp.]
MKKTVSLLISLILVLSLAAPFSARAEDTLYESETAYVNNSESVIFNGKVYYSCGIELYRLFSDKLCERNESFEVYYLSDKLINTASKRYDALLDIYLGATFDGLSETATDGDYALWAVDGVKAPSAVLNSESDGKYCYTLKAEITYFDTAAEEAEVDKRVSDFLNSLNINSKTDVEIIKALHDFICSGTVYDYTAAKSPRKHLYAMSPYGALVKKKAVCQGYAALFYRLCRELGYKARLLTSDPSFGCHAWNIVGLDGKFYTVDTMWDDEYLDSQSVSFTKDFYFLTDAETAKKYDNKGEHTLYSELYENNYFYAVYKNNFATKPYNDEKGKRFSSCKVTLSKTSFKYTGSEIKPTVKITDGDKLLTENKDYALTYSSNVKTGLARIDIKGLGDYSGCETHRLFSIVPLKAKKAYAKKITSKSIKLKWSSVKGASGYALQKKVNGKWKSVVETEKTSYTVSKLKPGTKYSFRIRAYKTVGKRNLYAEAGKYSVFSSKPAKAKIKSLKPAENSFTVKWTKRKCTGFQVQYSYNKNFKNAKSVKVKGSLNRTVGKLKSGKRCYVRVRAYSVYKNESGKKRTAYGEWCLKKSVKIK